MKMRNLRFGFVILFLGRAVSEHRPGDEVCTEGYIMDHFCIQRGTLLDNRDAVTLEAPSEHSVHCLVDVSSCRNSPFEVLHDPSPGEILHTRGFRLDNDSKHTVIALARQTGVCSTCTGEGDLLYGFRAGLLGTVVEAADGETPPVVAVRFAMAVSPDDEFCANINDILVPSLTPTSGPTATTVPTVVNSAMPTMSPTVRRTIMPSGSVSVRVGMLCRIFRFLTGNDHFCT